MKEVNVIILDDAKSAESLKQLEQGKSFRGIKVSCVNNQVHLLKMPNMEIMRSIAGIKLAISSLDLGGCYRDFYDLFENSTVLEVQVCEGNFQPIDDITMYNSLVSLSIDGNLIYTVDVKLPEEELGGLVTLKFWNQGSRAGKYFSSTVIYEPHRICMLLHRW
ncbi:hypothetical protein GUJ93_ZPchr0006g42292 [Zizania palustris]|uniref:Uncharacterized protein n=1 Tax=Zizania palustris TaxID=103762 RepID=A0A8J5SNT1_ZIZPA|nr:hypothetical protein GUJ93_ZPchr0006g42292 [Zizania palustris]